MSAATTAAKVYAAKVGVTGRTGGWLYDTRGDAICQGWQTYVGILTADGILRDIDGATMATRSDAHRGGPDGPAIRNVFDGGPVVLSDRLRRSDANRVSRALARLGAGVVDVADPFASFTNDRTEASVR